MTIFQPRRENVSVCVMAKDDLLQWAHNDLTYKAKLAYEGSGEFACGDWCRFCKAKAVCRKRAEYNLELAKYDFEMPDTLEEAEIAAILDKADELGIPVQKEVMEGPTGTNGWYMQICNEGIATSVVSLPLKYMHTPVEVLELEDIEQVARLLAAFAKGLGLDFKRIQFTPDVMPSDLTGFSIPDVQTKRFIYQPGVVFCNVLLADEINRTSPKTQSALLEVMEEGKVSVDGITRHVPQPFFVMATQNPDSAIGTQPLPEAQVDRFMIECSLDYPDRNAEIQLAQAMDSKKKIEHLFFAF